MAQKAQKLFAVRYSERPEEVFIQPFGHEIPAEGEASVCPSFFRVSPDGRVFYIVIEGPMSGETGVVSAKVKSYDIRGHLIRNVDIEHFMKSPGGGVEIGEKGEIIIKGSGELVRRELMIDTRGAYYVMYESGSAPSDCKYRYALRCLNPDGTLDKPLSETLNTSLLHACRQGFRGRLTGVTGTRTVCLVGRINHEEFLCLIEPFEQIKYIRLDIHEELIIDKYNKKIYTLLFKGDPIRVSGYNILAKEVRENDKTLSFEKIKIKVYDLTRNTSNEYELPYGGKPDAEQARMVRPKFATVDGRGHMYIQAQDRNLKVREIRDDEEFLEFRLTYPHYILEYDKEGRKVRLCAEIEYPSYGGLYTAERFWDVDRSGNLYYLRWTQKGIEVWMVSASKP